MSYSPKQLLAQEPSAVKAAILAILVALITTGVITLSSEAIAAWGLALELVLGLLYIRPLTVSKAGLSELDGALPRKAGAKRKP